MGGARREVVMTSSDERQAETDGDLKGVGFTNEYSRFYIT